MKPTRKRFKVQRGNRHITVYPWTHPQSGSQMWRFAWRRTPTAPWAYITRKTKSAATEKAEEILDSQAVGTVELAALSPARRRFLETLHREIQVEDEQAVLEYLASRKKSADLDSSVARFLTGKRYSAGEETPHLRNVRRTLDALAASFQGRSVVDIHLPELEAWFHARTAGLAPKSRKDIRANLVQFWRWSLREGIAGRDPITVAERLPSIAVPAGDRRVLAPEELTALLAAVRDEWRAVIVLGAFAGLRPEEIVPAKGKKKVAKRGLHCDEIDFRFNVIRVPACVSKVGRPRIVPISDALRSGLEWAGIGPGMTGPVVMRDPTKAGELARLGKLIFDGRWPQDSLRHSYGSYRNAVVRSLSQVAEEMGTSEAMLHRHYHNPRAEEQGHEWFAIRPPGVPICSDETDSTTPERRNTTG